MMRQTEVHPGNSGPYRPDSVVGNFKELADALA